ncbi:hypothetical protein K1719_027749 [Acacia pycnantha]|nr:hypothetical protein K1719_027749 [Acacia pycnantha]
MFEIEDLKLAFQAVMASDFAIAQFRFLERLLVIHGHWCYKRIAEMSVFPRLWLVGYTADIYKAADTTAKRKH